VLVRRARMQGKNACWVPGTDHASIATEAKVVGKLAAEGIKKTDLTRDEFLGHAWDWTHKHGGIILEQLKKLGASCDWDRTAFTMDEPRSESVLKVFVDLYNKGLIYRGVRMVNWDPKALTALSDEEVIHKEITGKLFYLKYKVASPSPSEGGDVNSTANYGYLTAKHTNYDLLKKYSKELRRFSTEAEAVLWEMLRRKNLEIRFRQQHIIQSCCVHQSSGNRHTIFFSHISKCTSTSHKEVYFSTYIRYTIYFLRKHGLGCSRRNSFRNLIL
jgi:hypothetical protein